ncbi:signal peptidase I [uncultured Ruminococcus sp.]|uniref:signal peptidase I n=1 Tax=uncultured Ruminococcus sp. TaxID=165186 RepID=UPI002600BB3B|nr:signal peptidase I [uncultured Ruminococcus sp.]
MDDNRKFGDVTDEDMEKAKQAAPDDLQDKQPVNVKDEIFEWAESFVFAMFIVILIFTFFFRIVLVQGPSMRETLQNGDRLIISHINYTPQKGDIVVINSEALNKTIIKRVIGTAGDKVVVDYNNNTVTVNGKVISNEHIKEAMYNTNLFDNDHEVEKNVYEYDVPEGKIFVMGDNRNNSTDSRRIGFIDPDDVLGKAVFRLFPFESIGKVQ